MSHGGKGLDITVFCICLLLLVLFTPSLSVFDLMNVLVVRGVRERGKWSSYFYLYFWAVIFALWDVNVDYAVLVPLLFFCF